MQNIHSLLAAHNDHIAKTTGLYPSFFIRTYGCQMNSRDSEMLAGLLAQLGYRAAESLETADLAVFNTCCVRESAENRIFGHLSRLRHTKETKRPDMLIAVGGCMSQQAEIAEKIAQSHPYINIVFGTANRHRLPEFLWQAIQSGKQVIDITEDDNFPELDTVPVTTRDYPHKAGVNIMYGCDNYCSYCIVPYVRGRERSRPAADILREIEALAADGVREIMLLGQNVNSYGKGLARTNVGDLGHSHTNDIYDFPSLLRRVNQIPGLLRIRFMTSHPKDFSDDLISAVRDSDKVCKSVHLPLQSGSTKVLKDMNRMYTQAEYLSLASRLKSAGIGLSTDIIVGYPGETEEDFEATLEVARQVRFLGAFTFIYSKRSGTPAATRKDLVPRNISAQRFQRLTDTIYPILLEINQAKVGSTLPVMVEEAGGTAVKGRTDDNTLVHFEAEDGRFQPGQVVPVSITLAKSFYICGEVV
ncbi:MAG: tRNA (N6-isopentenyl adenosine(37)-C2)-methylthiotransferase MiaB [Defluviitaleaceae bacterium]|nr:tRNA (N6-isopentenyl adenosine(37)-C2)-methylthiotransferase MiaB [Defluviitaleaceae bacterium]